MVEHKVFAEGVAKDIRKYLSPANADVECDVVEQKKNNGQMCVGISFTKPGQKLSPVIYVEPFYDEVRSGVPMEGIVQKIAQRAEESMGGDIPDYFSRIGEYDQVKEQLGVRLVNTKANRGELARIPHRELEDLSLIPVIRFPLPDADAYGSIKVTEDVRKEWGVSTEQVIEQALENEERPILQKMGDVVPLPKTMEGDGKKLEVVVKGTLGTSSQGLRMWLANGTGTASDQYYFTKTGVGFGGAGDTDVFFKTGTFELQKVLTVGHTEKEARVTTANNLLLKAPAPGAKMQEVTIYGIYVREVQE